MAHIVANSVKETSTSTGTGDFALSGAVTGFKTFVAGVGISNTTFYTIETIDASGLPTGEWEIGKGTVVATGPFVYALQRDTVLDSSSGSKVNFGSGTKLVYTCIPANLGYGMLSQVFNEISITGATTLTSAAFGAMHVCSGTSSDYTVTLPAASGNAGKMIGIRMDGALTKLVTIDGNSSETIDGATTRVMWAGESAILYCDGSGWTKIAGKSIPMQGLLRRTGSTSLGTSTFTKVPFDTSDINVGLVANTTNSRFDIRRTGFYNLYTFLMASPVGSGRTLAAFVYLNGSASYRAFHVIPGGADMGFTGGMRMSLSAGDYLELYGWCNDPTPSATLDTAESQTRFGIEEAPTW